MESRLKQILTLALRPDTGEGESAAALSAARRIVKREGMDSLWQPGAEKVVYRDREKIIVQEKVVYRDARHETSYDVTMGVSAPYLHNMLEKIFQGALKLGCQIQITSCKAHEDNLLSRTELKFTVRGTHSAVQAHYQTLESYLRWIRDRDSTIGKDALKASKSLGFWTWIKRKFS